MDATPEKENRNSTAAFGPASTQASSPRRSSRIKKPPPITPRRFNRFFTPRHINASQGGKGRRKALRDIPKAALNIRQNEAATPRSRKRRKLSFHSPTFSIPSSPIRHVGFLSSGQESIPPREDRPTSKYEVGDDSEATTDVEDEDDIVQRHARVQHYSRQGTSSAILSRRLGGRPRPTNLTGKDLWFHDTALFHTTAGDVNLDSGRPPSNRHILPFCVASCNTNPLVAVGDEEGHVRLIDSAYEASPKFAQSFLVMKPHDNAIMDLAFSEDDALLATASGDQTCHIIDVKTQQSRYSLAGHWSSVKRIQFQPGSSHMLSTCARDGDIIIWDTRQNPANAPTQMLQPDISSEANGVSPKCKIQNAHMSKLQPRLGSSFGRADFSVTSLTFIDPSRPHLFVTASESDSIVKLWDMRSTHRFRNKTIPISCSAEPKSHQIHRRFGITSLAVSTDHSTLYTLCRDHTVYAYSTSHLVLGSAPELSSTSRPFEPVNKRSPDSKAGIGPLYGFRHPALQVSTFYPKLAIRKATDSHPELIAVGSSDDCAVLFPTHPRYQNTFSTQIPSYQSVHHSTRSTNPSTRPRFTRLDSQSASLNFIMRRANDDPSNTLPIYYHGTPLVRGHSKEVTGVAWSSGGNLVSISDDCAVRCWRGDAEKARTLRVGREGEADRWGCGWADVGRSWDDDHE